MIKAKKITWGYDSTHQFGRQYFGKLGKTKRFEISPLNKGFALFDFIRQDEVTAPTKKAAKQIADLIIFGKIKNQRFK